MDLSRFAPEVAGTPTEPRPDRWPSWWWSRLELSPNTHRSFGHEAPLTRGWLHLAMVVVWPVGIVVLLQAADTGTAVAGAFAFGLAMQAMFTASAVTHLRRWDVWTTEALFRLDHCGIFLAIAGSMTPFTLLVLGGWLGWVMLGLVWTVAGAGIVASLWPRHTPVGFGNTSFITLGALAVPFVPIAWDRMGPTGVGLLLGGGALYIGGAILLAYQRPRLRPEVFGYHEVWHTIVVVAAGLHWLMVRDHMLPLG